MTGRASGSPGTDRWTGTLSGRITLVMMGIFVAFAATLGVTWYIVTAGWLSTGAKEKLDALADARDAALGMQVAQYREDLAAIVEPDLGDMVRALPDATAGHRPEVQKALTAEIVRHLRAAGLEGPAALFDPQGHVIAASRKLGSGDAPLPDTLVDGLVPALSRPFQVDDVWYLQLAQPIRNDRGELGAVLTLRVPAAPLLRITGNYRGLGETGETVLGQRQGDRILFIAPLRFQPDPSKLDSLSFSGPLATPMIAATSGQSGQSSAVDYRGVRVLANYRPVLGTPWGLVVKQDMAEILEGARRTRFALLLALLGLLGAALALVFPLVQSSLQPLRNLERATQRVAAGDLTVEVPEAGTSELRSLGSAFNTMVRRLDDARTESVRRQEELESFTYVVSHDLKAPLRGVNNLSEWLEQDLGEDLRPDSREHMRLLRERVASMNNLIDGLLGLSRVGRMDQPEQTVNVETLVAGVLDDLPPREGIAVSIPRPLPDVRADPVRLRQVFQNLVGNALAHHPGPDGTVEITARQTAEGWEFSVKDDGDGIDPRYHDRIFGIFQVLQRKPGTDSSGIGLAIVKKIVEGRGGTIRVESEGVPGQGATFFFTWPERANA